jgi:DNA-binding NarL/FixJ family response regulator
VVAFVSRIEAASSPGAEALEEPESPAPADSAERNELVCKLSAEGLSDEEIARRLDLGIGEVQLILNLKRTGDDAG